MPYYFASSCSRCHRRVWQVKGEDATICGKCKSGDGSFVECSICFSQAYESVRYARISNESWENERCAHSGSFCRGCLQRHLRSKLTEGCWSIRCPSPGCTYLLVEADIQNTLSVSKPTDESVAPVTCDLLDKNECELLLGSYQKLRGADHASHLRSVLAMQKAATDAELNGCGVSDHSYSACGFGQWALESCQACPRCLVIIRKETGCNHIQCRCGAGFCFGCGGPINVPGIQQQCLCATSVQVKLGRWLQESGRLEVGLPRLPGAA
jgi:hypothetical protein